MIGPASVLLFLFLIADPSSSSPTDLSRLSPSKCSNDGDCHQAFGNRRCINGLCLSGGGGGGSKAAIGGGGLFDADLESANLGGSGNDMVFRAAERTEARRSCAEDTDCNGGGGFGEEGLQGKRCVEGLCVEAMENIGGIGAGEREDADRTEQQRLKLEELGRILGVQREVLAEMSREEKRKEHKDKEDSTIDVLEEMEDGEEDGMLKGDSSENPEDTSKLEKNSEVSPELKEKATQQSAKDAKSTTDEEKPLGSKTMPPSTTHPKEDQNSDGKVGPHRNEKENLAGNVTEESKAPAGKSNETEKSSTLTATKPETTTEKKTSDQETSEKETSTKDKSEKSNQEIDVSTENPENTSKGKHEAQKQQENNAPTTPKEESEAKKTVETNPARSNKGDTKESTNPTGKAKDEKAKGEETTKGSKHNKEENNNKGPEDKILEKVENPTDKSVEETMSTLTTPTEGRTESTKGNLKVQSFVQLRAASPAIVVKNSKCTKRSDCFEDGSDDAHCIDGLCGPMPSCGSSAVDDTCVCDGDCDGGHKCVFGRCFSIRIIRALQAVNASCPEGTFEPDCRCFEERASLNGRVISIKNAIDRENCQRECKKNDDCAFWSFNEDSHSDENCYLRQGKKNLVVYHRSSSSHWVSGSKDCKLPENRGAKGENCDDKVTETEIKPATTTTEVAPTNGPDGKEGSEVETSIVTNISNSTSNEEAGPEPPVPAGAPLRPPVPAGAPLKHPAPREASSGPSSGPEPTTTPSTETTQTNGPKDKNVPKKDEQKEKEQTLSEMEEKLLETELELLEQLNEIKEEKERDGQDKDAKTLTSVSDCFLSTISKTKGLKELAQKNHDHGHGGSEKAIPSGGKSEEKSTENENVAQTNTNDSSTEEKGNGSSEAKLSESKGSPKGNTSNVHEKRGEDKSSKKGESEEPSSTTIAPNEKKEEKTEPSKRTATTAARRRSTKRRARHGSSSSSSTRKSTRRTTAKKATKKVNRRDGATTTGEKRKEHTTPTPSATATEKAQGASSTVT